MTRQFTVFSVGETSFALSVDHVREVLHATSLSAAPGNAAVEGLLNLRGHVIPVLEIRSRLGLKPQPLRASDFLIVIEDGSRLAAIRTEEAVRLETVDESAIERGSNNLLISGTLRLDDLIVSVLDLDQLMADITPQKLQPPT